MHIESSRFGTIEIRDDAVITFAGGLPGLPGEQWSLVATDENSPFFWLQSIEDADVAIPVTSPWLFFGDYQVKVPDDEASRLGKGLARRKPAVGRSKCRATDAAQAEAAPRQ